MSLEGCFNLGISAPSNGMGFRNDNAARQIGRSQGRSVFP
jgi:hypothetical protein